MTDQAQEQQQKPKGRRGFASMDRAKQREIASKGGKVAHAQGKAHEFDTNEARAAGRKGGMAVSRNREHMAQIGRRGGEARGRNAKVRSSESATPGQDANVEIPFTVPHGERAVR